MHPCPPDPPPPRVVAGMRTASRGGALARAVSIPWAKGGSRGEGVYGREGGSPGGHWKGGGGTPGRRRVAWWSQSASTRQHKNIRVSGTMGAFRLEKRVGPHPPQGTQPMPSHCPPDAKCQPQRHL